MRSITRFIPAIATIALCATALAAAAEPQQRDRDRGGRGRDTSTVRSAPQERGARPESGRSAPSRAESPRMRQPETAAPRAESPRMRQPETAAPRAESPRARQPEFAAPRAETRRTPQPEFAAPRAETRRAPQPVGPAFGGDVTRGRQPGYSVPRGDATRGRQPAGPAARGFAQGYGDRRGYASPRDRGMSPLGRVLMSLRPLFGPLPARHYVFRPHMQLGLGLWLGQSILFPSESYLYGRETYRDYGALSFEVDPADAYVYVDGYYVGAAGDFGPYGRPLSLRAGAHRIDLEAPGYQPVTFDVDVLPGQLIPFRGRLDYIGQAW